MPLALQKSNATVNSSSKGDGGIPPLIIMSEEISPITDEQYAMAQMVVTSTLTENLPILLVNNAEKNQEIKDLIINEIAIREKGVKRIIPFEEVFK